MRVGERKGNANVLSVVREELHCFSKRFCHEVSKGRKRELMELCGNLSNQAKICGRCLELNWGC